MSGPHPRILSRFSIEERITGGLRASGAVRGQGIAILEPSCIFEIALIQFSLFPSDFIKKTVQHNVVMLLYELRQNLHDTGPMHSIISSCEKR